MIRIKITGEEIELLDLDEVLAELKLETSVEIINPIMDIKPINICRVEFPEKISSGTLQYHMYKIIHNLFHINGTNCNIANVFSFLYYVNENHTNVKAPLENLLKLVNKTIMEIEETGEIRSDEYLVNVHQRKNTLHPEELKKNAGYANSKLRVNKSIEEIKNAKGELFESNKKITKMAVAELNGMSRKTVTKYWNSEPTPMDEILKYCNSHPITYIKK